MASFKNYGPRNSLPGLQVVLLPILLLSIFCLEAECFAFHPRRRHYDVGCTSCDARATSPLRAVTSPAVVSETISKTRVVAPGGAFHESKRGQVSLSSCNLLAPVYNSLALEDLDARDSFAEADRQNRFPLALEMAKKSNADILLLQEVEGGPLHEPRLHTLLQEPIVCPDGTRRAGYDSYLWSPLLPKRPDHVVGLCIAWRSSRHRLLASNCYRRGMVYQFSEVEDDSTSLHAAGTFAVANVHLPAKPSNIMGRLVGLSRTIQYLTAYDVPERSSPLDGLLVVGGDWNCDHTSVAARLLKEGRVPYGNVRDRNYKANVSKAVASRMKHGYRFRDVYEDVRDEYAPVTVSLHGRGPGCMDHLFYAQQRQGPKHRSQPDQESKLVKLINSRKGTAAMSRRKSRREKATRMRRASRGQSNQSAAYGPSNVQVQSLLATIAGADDTKRLEVIHKGLPNVEAGFPSDHIPIGAHFVPHPEYRSLNQIPGSLSPQGSDDLFTDCESSDSADSDSDSQVRAVGGIRQNVRRRREAGLASLSIRRRHNVVLRCVAEWLERRCGGIQENVIRDQSLYKNPWTNGAKGLTKKSRAPDIVCRIGQSLVVVEVTVVASSKVESVARQKKDKYSDLPTVLPTSPAIQQASLIVQNPVVIVLDEAGGIPESTKEDITYLTKLLFPKDPEKAQREAQQCCSELQALF